MTAGATAYQGCDARADILHRNVDYALEVSKEEGKNYQPIIDGENKRLKGSEALLRCYCEGFPATSPAEFILLPEDSGSICEVGKQVFTTAIKQAKIWQETLPELLVSVSYIQLKDSDFKKFVKKELEQYDYPAGNLIPELKENCKVVELKHIRDEMDNSRMAGIKAAMDDLGTGYASISVLRELPTDIAILDYSFVGNVKEQENDNIIMNHLIGMCIPWKSRSVSKGQKINRFMMLSVNMSQTAFRDITFQG